MSKTDIRICGMGGQGVIMTGLVLGKAVSIFEDRFATMIQSFGPEARGSTCSSQVILSDERIGYAYIKKSDVFLAFNQASYDKYIHELKDGGLLIYENELTVPDDKLPKNAKTFGIPATRLTIDEIGKLIVFNMVMVGFLTAHTDSVNLESVKKAIEDSVPEGTEALNLKAFELGYSYKE
jgi:2-oxoglutarate ferredoxin oxidoreductase subunit gamma